jgi:hypothetical protein
MHGAGDARVEAVNRPEDLERLRRVVHDVRVLERRLVGPRLPLSLPERLVEGLRIACADVALVSRAYDGRIELAEDLGCIVP